MPRSSGDLIDADIVLVFEVGENLGPGPCASVAWASSKYPSVFRVMAKYGSRVVFATNPDRGECRFRRVGACGVVVSREAMRRRCLARFGNQYRRSSKATRRNRRVYVSACAGGTRKSWVRAATRLGVVCAVRIQPARINGRHYRRVHPAPWEVPRSGAFNAERRKPVVDRGEPTQKTYQAVKGPWVAVG